MRPAEVTYRRVVDGRVYEFAKTPALICSQCGEGWLEPEVWVKCVAPRRRAKNALHYAERAIMQSHWAEVPFGLARPVDPYRIVCQIMLTELWGEGNRLRESDHWQTTI